MLSYRNFLHQYFTRTLYKMQCMQVARQNIDVINLVEEQQFKVNWLGSDTEMGF